MAFLLVSLALLLATLFGYYVAHKRRPKRNYPPGPRSYPLIGSPASFSVTDVTGVYYNFAKKYGPICKVDFAGYATTMLNEPNLIKDAFSREEFVGRPSFWAINERNRVSGGGPGADGIIFAEGESWKEHRRFVLHSFRDFGVGKFKMEEKTMEEAVALGNMLQDRGGSPVDTRLPLNAAVANITASVLTGVRYDVDDQDFKTFVRLSQESSTTTWQMVLLAVFPSLRHFPLRRTYGRFVEMLQGLQGFQRKPIESHLLNWVPDRNADFMEHYISAVKSGSHRTFSMSHIPLLMQDLFEAGSETASTTLRWAFILMAFHPDVQERIQQELDENVPQGEIPSSTKYKMPYTEASMVVIHRFASVAPFGVPHRATKDTTLGPYEIPKDTWISSNIHYCHYNDEWWDNPKSFDPTRFLSENMDIKQSEYLIPFSLGKRRCPGEGLAKTEVFILFAAITQRFKIQLAQEPQKVDLRPVAGGVDTKPHKLCFIQRKTRPTD